MSVHNYYGQSVDNYYAQSVDDDYAQLFVEELIRAGVILAEVLDTLLEGVGEDDIPGDCSGQALMQMLTGTLRPVISAAGEGPVRQITPLFDACVQRTLADLQRALGRSGERGD